VEEKERKEDRAEKRGGEKNEERGGKRGLGQKWSWPHHQRWSHSGAEAPLEIAGADRPRRIVWRGRRASRLAPREYRHAAAARCIDPAQAAACARPRSVDCSARDQCCLHIAPDCRRISGRRARAPLFVFSAGDIRRQRDRRHAGLRPATGRHSEARETAVAPPLTPETETHACHSRAADIVAVTTASRPLTVATPRCHGGLRRAGRPPPPPPPPPPGPRRHLSFASIEGVGRRAARFPRLVAANKKRDGAAGAGRPVRR